MAFLHAAQDTPDRGLLQVNVVSSENNFPVENATVSIANSRYTGTDSGGTDHRFLRSDRRGISPGSPAGIQPAGQ